MNSRYRNLLLLTGLSLLLASCGKESISEFFPEEYYKILYVKGDAQKNVVLNTTQGVIGDTIVVLKSGAYPETRSTVALTIMSEDDVINDWNLEAGSFKILPSNAYELPAGDVTMAADEWYKDLAFSYDPAEIYKSVKADRNVTWVLPLRLTSTDSSVNKDKDHILLEFNVSSPIIVWTATDVRTTILDDILHVSLSIALDKPGMTSYSITCQPEVENADAVVRQYNDSLGTNYEAMPANACSFTPVTLSPDNNTGVSDLRIVRESLKIGHSYLLPVSLGALSSDIVDKSNELRYVIVNYIDESQIEVLQENADGTYIQGTKGNSGKTVDSSDEVLSKKNNFSNP